MIGRLLPALLNALFPPACPLCRHPLAQPHRLCAACHSRLPGAPENLCLRCGSHTAAPQQGCGACLDRPHSADAAYFAFRYEQGMRDLILGFKFGDQGHWGTLLGQLCRERLEGTLHWESPDLVLPIPLHFSRLFRRHYNQSALLAGEVARFLERPLVTNGLKRIKMTAPQTRLGSQARRANVRGAFRADPERVRGRALLLVDDVYTTGSTMEAAVTCLKRAGAGRVALLCLARAEPDRDRSGATGTAAEQIELQSNGSG